VFSRDPPSTWLTEQPVQVHIFRPDHVTAAALTVDLRNAETVTTIPAARRPIGTVLQPQRQNLKRSPRPLVAARLDIRCGAALRANLFDQQ
jgi:hypothetical protein